MPRRELLSEPQWRAFIEPVTDERGMVRHYTLSSEDLALIDRRRGDPNRLGFAVMLCYLRIPGRILQQGEAPPVALLALCRRTVSARSSQFR
jgi:TnpA family transposase